MVCPQPCRESKTCPADSGIKNLTLCPSLTSFAAIKNN